MILLLIWANLAVAQCNWGELKLFGTYSGDVLAEASGMTTLNGEIFFINDGEGDGAIYRYDLKKDLKRISLDISPRNLEAISVGDCGDRKCFYLADTGDNKGDRKFAEVFEIEAETYRVKRSWRVNYPDGPRNVEAFLVTKNGDFYFLSKSGKKKKKDPSEPVTSLYFVGAEELKNPSLRAEKVADVKGISAPVTDMALSDDGKTVAILSKESAYELPFPIFVKGDFSGISEIPIQRLLKQESIAFLSNDTLLWSTEAENHSDVPIQSLRCR